MVYILLGNGFEETEALVPTDLLRRAGIEVCLVALDEGRLVTGANAITVKADCTIEDIQMQHLEMLILPGGLGGVKEISNSKAALSLIEQVHEQGKWLCAICAAPSILAKLGLLNGKDAVCFPSFREKLDGATYIETQDVVVTGNIITAKAAGSSFAFGHALITALKGEERAQKVLDAVYYPPK